MAGCLGGEIAALIPAQIILAQFVKSLGSSLKSSDRQEKVVIVNDSLSHLVWTRNIHPTCWSKLSIIILLTISPIIAPFAFFFLIIFSFLFLSRTASSGSSCRITILRSLSRGAAGLRRYYGSTRLSLLCSKKHE